MYFEKILLFGKISNFYYHKLAPFVCLSGYLKSIKIKMHYSLKRRERKRARVVKIDLFCLHRWTQMILVYVRQIILSMYLSIKTIFILQAFSTTHGATKLSMLSFFCKQKCNLLGHKTTLIKTRRDLALSEFDIYYWLEKLRNPK